VEADDPCCSAFFTPPLPAARLQIIDGGIHNYTEELRAAKFCLAPYGAGWGIRVTISMAHGCVPVIIQDHVYQVGGGQQGVL
jgi:hypothetical protein